MAPSFDLAAAMNRPLWANTASGTPDTEARSWPVLPAQDLGRGFFGSKVVGLLFIVSSYQ